MNNYIPCNKSYFVDGLAYPLHWVLTCTFCPEQYEVYCNGILVAYIRERHNYMCCSYKGVFGKTIWEKNGEELQKYADEINKCIAEEILNEGNTKNEI